MKWIWALAGAMALSACGNGAGTATLGEQSQAATVPSPQPNAIAGIYGANGVDGQPWTSELAADGTYRNTIAGQVSEAGTWSHADNRLCFRPEGDADQATPATTCLTVIEVSPDGSLVLSDDAGNQTTAPRLPSPAPSTAPVTAPATAATPQG